MRNRNSSRTPIMIKILKLLKAQETCTVKQVQEATGTIYRDALVPLMKLRKAGYIRYKDTTKHIFVYSITPDAADVVDALIYHYGHLTDDL